MIRDLEERLVEGTPLAAVRREVAAADVATAWRPALDLVWAFLRERADLLAGGHNVFVYYHPADAADPMTVEFGVEVARSFDGDGRVEPAWTPAGRVVTALHVGPVEGLREAYTALETWRAAHRERFAGISWETYGDWGDDPGTFETRVTSLLA